MSQMLGTCQWAALDPNRPLPANAVRFQASGAIWVLTSEPGNLTLAAECNFA